MNELSIGTTFDERKEPEIYGEKIGFFARIFGCWHPRISRPLTIGKETYCVCVTCGARRRFDVEILQSVGDYYYPPRASLYNEPSTTKNSLK